MTAESPPALSLKIFYIIASLFLIPGIISCSEQSSPADIDSDGIIDEDDNCPYVPNPNQLDSDGDGTGDLCEQDLDGDGVIDDIDNCQSVINPGQQDFDR